MNASSSTSSAGLQFTHPYLAVVLGGGFTGMLAAAALSAYADVIVVERERLPRTPVLPTDLPQPRHTHLLAADGARVVEGLLPGAIDRWLAEGAHRLPAPTEPAGPLLPGRPARRTRTREVFACSRDLLDRGVRDQVPVLTGVSILDSTEAERLTGTAEHVTGVWVKDIIGGETYRLDADLVVDATGRSSTTPDRLAALGLPAAPEDVRDSGIVCATRIFRAPPGQENCPVLTARSGGDGSTDAPDSPHPATRTATLVPIEDGRWLVTLTGSGTDRPSQRADAFVPFARRIHAAIGDLIADAEPLSEVRVTRDTTSRRHHYEQLSRWPTGFVALGGAVASINPDYGQGLSLAAHGATALRNALRRYGLDEPALAHRVQRAVGDLVEAPWALATGAELPRSPHPNAASLAARLVRGAVPGAHLPAAALPPVCRAYVDVITPAVHAARPPQAFAPRPASTAPAPTVRPPGVDTPEPPSPLSSLFSASATAALTAAPPPVVPGSPGSAAGSGAGTEQPPRRLPRPLGFGPGALRLRRFNSGRRKPDGS
ncbi:FAD-dependent monooxygenase [Streptomyces sp. NPDC090442]|uniref:NAD(P)/FAD-dependent oxidoreductase n=1 Tax=Streptomyces sp. NPDC090442 TaxID=3365962 RepID=UPI00382A3EBB